MADTDLRPEGDPEVLAVLVFNDTANAAVESATYCKPNDPKRPGKVGLPAYGVNPIICPLDGSGVPELTDAWPDAWYVRIMFDELLDPEIETLEPVLDAMGNPTDNFNGSLAQTQPVTLRCQQVTATGALGDFVDVDYDGYYSPSGNSVTWPLGPSLVIKPTDPTIVPVESECEITLKESIKDKDGNSVPAADRQPFKFKIAPISVIAVSPGDGDAIDPLVGGVGLDFNVEIDPATTFCSDPANPACFSITPVDMAAGQSVSNDGTSLFVSAELVGGQAYTLKIPEGLKVKDKCGKESTLTGAPQTVEFETNPFKFVSINPGGGNAVAPAKKIVLSFNQLIDPATFTEGTDFEISPKPANFSVTAVGAGQQIRLNGDYNLGTRYTLTIKAGASISDAFTPAKQMVTFPADVVADFTTIGAIAITAQTPANGARIVKPANSAAAIRLTFNQEIAAGSLDATEFTLTKADGTATGVTPTITIAGANVTVSAPALPAGSYKFTLKAGAMLTDRLANNYTQAADRVITFTVADAPPPGPNFKCLGAP